jgi:hypothetical protein
LGVEAEALERAVVFVAQRVSLEVILRAVLVVQEVSFEVAARAAVLVVWTVAMVPERVVRPVLAEARLEV